MTSRANILQTRTHYNPELKIWSGIKMNPLYGPECSIGQVALDSLMKDPEHIAQISANSGKCYTNHEIATLSIRVAQHFQKLKIPQCEVIGICASNSDYVAPLFFGALLSGLSISTLDPSFDKDGIKHTFSITEPKIFFCDGGIYQSVKEAFDKLGLESVIYTIKDHIAGVADINEFLQETGLEDSFICAPLKMGYNQTAAILCSSGTTGLPKGVCMSHNALLNIKVLDLDSTDKLLSFSTLYWASGLITLLAGTIDGATRVISDRAFNVDDYLTIISKFKITSIISPPSQIAMALASQKIQEFDLSSVKTYFCGGSAFPYVLVEKMKKFMTNATFVIGYGMSEVNGPIVFGPALPNGSTGQLAPNVDVKIINDDGKLLGPNEVGEICMRTIYPWAGYMRNPEATAEMYENKEWIHSGDIGYIDDNGDVFVIDRKKDILKYNNFHYTPSEIEKVIMEIPEVTEVCVCGIPDIISSHLPAAAVIKKEGSTLSEQDVYDYVATKMTHFKHLRGGVYFLNDFPRTPSGKVLRRKVQEICEKLRNAHVLKEGSQMKNIEG